MDGAPAGYLFAVARVASLSPPVVFHVKFPATIAACRSRSASPLASPRPGDRRSGSCCRCLEIFNIGGYLSGAWIVRRTTTTCPAGTISVPVIVVWMPQPRCSSDMAGTSTPYARPGQRAPGGIRSHRGHSDHSTGCPAPQARLRQTGSIPAGSKRGNRRRKNIVALSVRYSYHGFMTFWTAAKRYGCLNPSSQLEAALNARTVAM